MSNPIAEKLYLVSNRLHFQPPYKQSEFVCGHVYDPSSPWEKLRAGAVVPDGTLLLAAMGDLEKLTGPETVVEWVSDYKGKIAYNLLTDAEAWASAGVDVSKYFAVVGAVNAALRDADNYGMFIQELLNTLNDDPSLNRVIIEDAIRMTASYFRSKPTYVAD